MLSGRIRPDAEIDPHACRPLAFDQAPDLGQLARPLRRAIGRAQQYLLSRQAPTGAWSNTPHGNPWSTAAWLLTRCPKGGPLDDSLRPLAAYLLAVEREEGGWSRSQGAPLDLSLSVICYWALKQAGEDPSGRPLSGARRAIRLAGGADATDVATRLWLAWGGQIPYEVALTAWPHALALESLPSAGSLSETAVVDLAKRVIAADRPRRPTPVATIRELFLEQPQRWPVPDELPRTPAGRGRPPRGARRFPWTARAARLEADRALSQARQQLAAWADSPATTTAHATTVLWCRLALDHEPSGQAAPLQPASSPPSEPTATEEPIAWISAEGDAAADGARVLEALLASGISVKHRAAARALVWLADQPEERDGRRPLELAALAAQLSGESPLAANLLPAPLELIAEGSFEHLDDARSAIAGLDRAVRIAARAKRALEAASPHLEKAPAPAPRRRWYGAPAAGPAPLPCPVPADRLARWLLAAGQAGGAANPRDVSTAIDQLAQLQRADGSWLGDESCGPLRATALVLRGLVAVNSPETSSLIESAAAWVLMHQLAEGGWGEPLAAQSDRRLTGTGPASVVTTAEVLRALIAAGRGTHPAVARGAAWLIDAQSESGHWEDALGGDFDPRDGAVVRNPLRETCEPLAALGELATNLGQWVAQCESSRLRVAVHCDEL